MLCLAALDCAPKPCSFSRTRRSCTSRKTTKPLNGERLPRCATMEQLLRVFRSGARHGQHD